MRKSILDEAIAAAGGVMALAQALGISHQAVSLWKRCPATRVLDVERLSGISRYKLRPDVFGPPGHGGTPSP
jgi:DNA-binding transcriptional regulator YdaS (Cro superfamily)